MKLAKLLVLLCVLAIVPIAAQGAAGILLLAKSAGGPTFTNQLSAVNSSCGFAATCPVTLTVATGFNVFAISVNNQSAGSVTVSGAAVSGCSTATLTQAQTNTIPSSGVGVALFYGTVPTGGSCTVTVTVTVAGIQAAGVAVGLLSNLSSTTPGTGCQAQSPAIATSIYSCGSSITVNAGGYGVCAIGYNSATTMTSTNLTIESQTPLALSSIGIADTGVTETPVFSGSPNQQAGIACAPWS